MESLAHNQAQSGLFRLPVEIRLAIYGLIASTPWHVFKTDRGYQRQACLGRAANDLDDASSQDSPAPCMRHMDARCWRPGHSACVAAAMATAERVNNSSTATSSTTTTVHHPDTSLLLTCRRLVREAGPSTLLLRPRALIFCDWLLLEQHSSLWDRLPGWAARVRDLDLHLENMATHLGDVEVARLQALVPRACACRTCQRSTTTTKRGAPWQGNGEGGVVYGGGTCGDLGSRQRGVQVHGEPPGGSLHRLRAVVLPHARRRFHARLPGTDQGLLPALEMAGLVTTLRRLRLPRLEIDVVFPALSSHGQEADEQDNDDKDKNKDEDEDDNDGVIEEAPDGTFLLRRLKDRHLPRAGLRDWVGGG